MSVLAAALCHLRPQAEQKWPGVFSSLPQVAQRNLWSGQIKRRTAESVAPVLGGFPRLLSSFASQAATHSTLYRHRRVAFSPAQSIRAANHTDQISMLPEPLLEKRGLVLLARRRLSSPLLLAREVAPD